MEMEKNRLGNFKGLDKRNNVYSFLEKHFLEIPDHPVLKWVKMEDLMSWPKDLSIDLPHQSVSIKELYFLSNRLAKGFHDLGIEKGDRVILFVPMSLYLYASMFALQKIGAIPTFLDSWARRGQLGVSAQIVSPKAMISFQKAFDLIENEEAFRSIPLTITVGPTNKNVCPSLEKLAQSSGDVAITPVLQEDTALITFTTGSSGTPKGADRSHRFLAAQHYALHRSLPYEKNDIDLPVFPIFSLNNLAEGVTTVIPAFDVGVPSPHDPLIIMAQIKACHINCTTLSPSLLKGLAQYCIENQLSLPHLKRGITGGAPVNRDDLIKIKKAAPNAQIWVLYGSTEVEPIAHIEASEMLALQSASDKDFEMVDEGVNVGHFDEGLKRKFIKIHKSPITIANENDWKNWEVDFGEVGEIIVAGEHVCHYYFNNQEAFITTKIKDYQGVIWHRTGDLGRVDSKGYLWLVGRVHNAIERKGVYAFPVRAEMILKKLPFTKECAYLGISDEQLTEKTVCVVELKEKNQQEDGERLRFYEGEVKRIMNKNQVPVDQVIFYHAIPMDPRHHSKVEYQVLRNSLIKENLV